MSIQFQFSTNPQTTSTHSEERIAQLKEQQEGRRAELFGFVQEYREAYKESQKACAKAQSIFLMQQRELAKHKETDKDYAKFEKEYKNAKKAYRSASSEQDLRLQLLQYRTDNYVKASRINLIDLA